MHLISLLKQKIYVLNTMIKKNIIKNAPTPVGNYVHSIELNGMLYLSGVGPRDPNNNKIPGNKYDEKNNISDYDIKQQTHAVMDNVKNILEGSNSSWDNLIDITVFLTDMKNDFKKFNQIYNLYFKDSHACRTTIEVNALPTDIAIELKCIAVIKK